ncbi:MAG: hypothetical protein ACOZNI_03315 [Myxococcota bacterium]
MAVPALLACWPAVAVAAPGDHIRTGDTVITPSVATGLEFHSNAYLADGVDQPVFPALAWTLNPRLRLDLEGEDLQLNFGAGWAMKKFIDLTPDAINLSNLDRFSDVDATLGIHALNRNLLGLRLDNAFEIASTPTELPTSGQNANLVHLSNDLNAGVAIRPGSALELAVLGNLGIDRYNVPAELTTDPNINNRATYGPMLQGSWKFLPKTKLVGSGSVVWHKWENNLVASVAPDVEGLDYGSYIGKPDSLVWRTSWGIRGQFTDKLAASAELGYGQMYYDEESVLADAGAVAGSSAELDVTGEESFARDLTSFSEGFTINAQVAYAPIRGHQVLLGYRKDFQDAFFTNYVAYNYVFLRYEGLYASRFGLTAEASYRIDVFHGEVARGDQNIKLKLNGAYRFTDFFSASLGGGWTERACFDSSCDNGTFYATQYDDFYGTATLTFTY